jgi:YVTN family beta-propeller protein
MTIRSNDVTRRVAGRGRHLRRYAGRALVAVGLSASVFPALAVLDSGAPAGAQSVTATIPVGQSPKAVAVDATTDMIYVANTKAGTVTVIDGSNNTVTATVTVGASPRGVAVDETTDTVYVADAGSNAVSVIDGTNDMVTATIPVGTDPIAVAVDETTDSVYVANFTSNSISVIDGSSDSVTATVNTRTGTNPFALAVDPATDTVYVALNAKSRIDVVSGESDAITAKVPVASPSKALAVDPSTDTVYVADTHSSSVSVVDGTMNTVTATIPVGSRPKGVAVDAASDTIYVADGAASAVSIIDGGTATVSDTLSVGTNPFAAASNEATDEAYVSNAGSNTVSVISTAAQASVVLGADSNPVSVGQSVTYTATVSGVTATATPTGNVNFSDGSSPISSCQDVGLTAVPDSPGSASASCVQSYSTVNGSPHSVSATYTGDTVYAQAGSNVVSETVNPVGTSTQLSVPTSLTYGAENASPLTVSVSTLDGAVPTGTVAITSGATTVCPSITLSGGTGSCTLTTDQLSGGTYPLTATYTPDSGDFGGSSATGTLVIGQEGTVLTAHKAKSISLTELELSATLTTTGGTAIPGETITFSFAGTELCTAVTDASGLASCDINPALVISILGTGSYDAVFAGDASYLGSSGSAKV